MLRWWLGRRAGVPARRAGGATAVAVHEGRSLTTPYELVVARDRNVGRRPGVTLRRTSATATWTATWRRHVRVG